MSEGFDLPPHDWKHIVATGPDGKGHYPGVQWWHCVRCNQSGPMGVGPDEHPIPGTCWGKKPLTAEQKRLFDAAMAIIMGEKKR